MTQRLFAGVWLLICIGFGYLATQFEVLFSYEPVGPKAWPLTLATLMAAASLWLLFKPGAETQWPDRKTLLRIAILALVLFAYAWFFEQLGFPIATALMTIVVGMLFGGNVILSVTTGLVAGVGLYLFFDKLLDVVLPLGLLRPLLGG